MKDVKNILPDETEPSVRQGTVFLPMWIVGLLGFLIYWSFNYIDERGGYDQLVYEPYISTNQLASFLPTDETAAQLKFGGQIYKQYCEGCHQQHGGGNAGQAPPLAGSEWVLAGGPNRIIRIPITGLTGPIKVKDTEWNLTMFSVGAALKDEELAAVLTYIRNSWGNKASAVNSDHVKKVRADLKGRTEQHTADELNKLSDAVQP